MSDENKLFGRRGDAARILEEAKNKMAGQTMSPEKLAKAQRNMLERSAEDHTNEAAGFTEEILNFLNNNWNNREFTLEQRIFSIALATINLRNHLPLEQVPEAWRAANPGKQAKDFFDSEAAKAWVYYRDAISG